MLENNKWVKWGTIFISALIIVSFFVQDRFGMMMNQTKYFAKIDGKPINSQKFFQILDYQIKSIKDTAPHLTSDDFKMAKFPEQMLDQYIYQLIKVLELQNQGFIISEPMLVQKTHSYGENFTQHFRHADTLRKKSILEDMRKELIEQQLFLSYRLPKAYQELVYKSFRSRRVFDMVTIHYDDIKIKGEPSSEELVEIAKKYADELMEDEKRSFFLVNLTDKKYHFSDEELESYYKTHKENFVMPEKKHIVMVSSMDAKYLEKIIKKTKNIVVLKKDSKLEVRDLGFVKEDDLDLKEAYSSSPDKILISQSKPTVYLKLAVKKALIPHFKDIKKEVYQYKCQEQVEGIVKNLKEKIENDEINIDDIPDHKVETFQNVSKNDVFKYGVPLLNFIFDQDPNILSETFQDPISGNIFVVQVSEVVPEAQMTGEQLKKAVQKIWIQNKQEEEAKKDLDTLFNLESKEAEFYAFVKEKGYQLKSNLSVDRVTQKMDDVDPELLYRVFTVGTGKIVYTYTPKGIVIGRILKDTLHQEHDFDEKKVEEYFMKTAYQSVSQMFLIDISLKHKIEKDIEFLNDECHF